jgi:predicted enzyme related to lactoylglutathione lyase
MVNQIRAAEKLSRNPVKRHCRSRPSFRMVVLQTRIPFSPMHVEKVKYVLWAADWQRCLKFYRELFGGVVSFESEVWSEIVIAGATLGIHGGGEGQRTWTGLSFQLDDLREGIVRLLECGGALTREPNDTPDDPLHLAMCVDPEGNEFMMTQKRH